ncbi:uncharacterized serine-rich protein C215.13-like [Vigna angularis]|uniref:uncharacterized serine-rich protein C215.13-like n=1 Tax=Phaseolus angularis TaxID=3914 RepID=UPI0022B4E7DA|nr:uncharacterized serine-rich protein C215.13-like [Vigna angularis]
MDTTQGKHSEAATYPDPALCQTGYRAYSAAFSSSRARPTHSPSVYREKPSAKPATAPLPRHCFVNSSHRATASPILSALSDTGNPGRGSSSSHVQTSTRLAAASHRSRRQSRRNLSSSVVRRRREVLSLLPPYVSPTSTNSKLIHHSTYKYFITSVHPNPKLTEHLHSHQSKLQIKLRTCAVPAPSRPSISIPPGGASTSNPTLVLRPTSPPTLHCSSPTTASWVWISPPAATSPTATTLSVGRRYV